MMILSCTKKIRDKLKKSKELEDEKVDLSISNWYVDLIRLNRKEYYLFTNSVMLYSFLTYIGTEKEKKNLESIFRSKLIEAIKADFGISESSFESKLFTDNDFRYVKTNSRSILGVMNDYKYQIEVLIWHKEITEEDYESLRHYLNECPMSTINYSSGKKEMAKFLSISE
ncbi:MAG: hypothetical protein R2795_18780 [Saprospiraceae bacterium]